MLLRITTTLLLVSALALPQINNPVPDRSSPWFKGDKNKKDDGSRTVAGVVRDENDQPADGAIVKIKDTKSLQIRSYRTKPDGRYQFFGLAGDVDYELKAERERMTSETKTLSVFDSRKQPVINLKLEPQKTEKN